MEDVESNRTGRAREIEIEETCETRQDDFFLLLILMSSHDRWV